MEDIFAPRQGADVADLVRAYPLCWLVSGGNADRHATPLPLLAETDATGVVRSLLGHMAVRNPQRAELEAVPTAAILCMGAQGYISPRLVSHPTWGPTWNYAVCRFEVDVHFVPEENEHALWQLARALEGSGEGAWTPKRMGERYDVLKHRIIAFRARVRETHAKFKLGQDESDLGFADIVGGLADRSLAEWMKRTRA
jgi:transcriptional regulator